MDSSQRHLSRENARILDDLVNKSVDNVMKGIKTTCELAMDTAGVSGLFAITLRVASFGVMGAVTSMRDADKNMRDDDARLLIALILAVPDRDKRADMLGTVNTWFKQLTGRDAPRIPFLDPKNYTGKE